MTGLKQMFCLRIEYKSRVYHRRQTLGGMDSEPNGSSIDEQTYRVVISGKSDRDVKNAVLWFEGEKSHEKDFEIIGAIIEHQIHAVLRKPITNLNIQ